MGIHNVEAIHSLSSLPAIHPWARKVCQDTLNSLELDKAIDDTFQLGYSCPEYGVNFDLNDITHVPAITDWHICGTFCNMTPDCKFWTLDTRNQNCWLKSSDDGFNHLSYAISGVKGCRL